MSSCSQCGAPLAPDDARCATCGAATGGDTAQAMGSETIPRTPSGRPTTFDADDDDDFELDPPTALIGKTIAGNFDVLELIGEGAMGRVYKARQRSLDKPVAIKVLHRHLALDPRIAKRFHREARAASRLSHANSLQIIDFGAAEDGRLYIAMELLEGDDLQEIIEKQSPLTPRRIEHLLAQVLRALDEAHHAGIIHRDLKPENVIVVPGRSAGEERVKVCDFGIAKIQDAEGGSAITMSGFVCGTPEYMSPEQARGEELDPRADVYSAGVILYQMLTGVVPFTADNALGIITKQLTEPVVPPRKKRPDLKIPPALEAVCMKALSKAREGRFGSASELSAAISDAVRALGAEQDRPLGSGAHDPGAAEAGTGTFATSDEFAKTVASIPSQAPASKSGMRSLWIVTSLIVLLAGAAYFWMRTATAEPSEGPPSHGAGPGLVMPGPVAPTAVAPHARLDEDDAGVPLAAVDGDDDAGVASGPDEGTPRTRHGVPTGREVVPSPHAGAEPAPSPTSGSEDPLPASSASSPFDLAYAEGRRLFLANDVRSAIRQFEEAAHLMPQNAQVQKQLGRAYMRAGDSPRGISAYRRYLELSPQASDRTIIERLIAEGH